MLKSGTISKPWCFYFLTVLNYYQNIDYTMLFRILLFTPPALLYALGRLAGTTKNVQLVLDHFFNRISSRPEILARIELPGIFCENLPDFSRQSES